MSALSSHITSDRPRSAVSVDVAVRGVEFHQPQCGRSEHLGLEVGGRQLHDRIARTVQTGAGRHRHGAQRQSAHDGAEEEGGAHGEAEEGSEV